jgi:hypothetical protein
MGDWSPGDVSALAGNPFYAIEIDPGLCEPHEPLVGEDEWISANARSIEDEGAERWLVALLAALKGQGPSSDDDAGEFTAEDVAKLIANPFYAIEFDPSLAAAHDPLVDERTWIAANVNGNDDLGPEPWLRNLLVVLKGATADRLDSVPKVGRNDPCPCGSGLKYKHCHGK